MMFLSSTSLVRGISMLPQQMWIRDASAGTLASASLSASTFSSICLRKFSSDPAPGAVMARSGQSTWRMKPARWIASYSSRIAAASALRYSSWLP